MPAGKQSKSRTVDLHGLTLGELRDLVDVAWEMEKGGRIPDEALPALVRLNTACRTAENSPKDPLTPRAGIANAYAIPTLWKVPRVSLAALVDALRPALKSSVVAEQYTRMPDGLAKLELRLASKPGPPELAGVWAKRKQAIRAATAKLRREHHREPTGADIAEAIGVKPGTIRIWRRRRPELFAD